MEEGLKSGRIPQISTLQACHGFLAGWTGKSLVVDLSKNFCPNVNFRI